MAKNTSPLVVAVTGATTSAVNGSSICRLSGIDAERIGLPALPIIFLSKLKIDF